MGNVFAKLTINREDYFVEAQQNPLKFITHKLTHYEFYSLSGTLKLFVKFS